MLARLYGIGDSTVAADDTPVGSRYDSRYLARRFVDDLLQLVAFAVLITESWAFSFSRQTTAAGFGFGEAHSGVVTPAPA